MVTIVLILFGVILFLYIFYKLVWKNHNNLIIINSKIITAIIIYNEYYLQNAAISSSLAFYRISFVF